MVLVSTLTMVSIFAIATRDGVENGRMRCCMYTPFLVRLTIGLLVVLGIKLSAIYFLAMIVLLNTHHKEFFGW